MDMWLTTDQIWNRTRAICLGPQVRADPYRQVCPNLGDWRATSFIWWVSLSFFSSLSFTALSKSLVKLFTGAKKGTRQIAGFQACRGMKQPSWLFHSDGVNLSVPEATRAQKDPIFAPWPHVDQSPFRTNLQCVQGVVNLLPNGPQDGGLTVLEGSNKLYSDLWKHFDHKKGDKGWNTWEQQYLDEEMSQWLEDMGCKWVKVCCEPGDLLLWDSVSSKMIKS